MNAVANSSLLGPAVCDGLEDFVDPFSRIFRILRMGFANLTLEGKPVQVIYVFPSEIFLAFM